MSEKTRRRSLLASVPAAALAGSLLLANTSCTPQGASLAPAPAHTGSSAPAAGDNVLVANFLKGKLGQLAPAVIAALQVRGHPLFYVHPSDNSPHPETFTASRACQHGATEYAVTYTFRNANDGTYKSLEPTDLLDVDTWDAPGGSSGIVSNEYEISGPRAPHRSIVVLPAGEYAIAAAINSGLWKYGDTNGNWPDNANNALQAAVILSNGDKNNDPTIRGFTQELALATTAGNAAQTNNNCAGA